MRPPYGVTRAGNVRLLMGSKIVIGPDWRFFCFVWLMTFVASLLFVTYTCTVTAGRIVTGVVAVATLLFLTAAGLSNPGVQPKSVAPPPDGPAHEPRLWNVTHYAADGSVTVSQVEQKWCYSCHHYRPYRGVHCRFCDVCVTRRDHHCPWTGICVGAGNYLAYFCLVWSASVLALSAFISSVQSLTIRARRVRKANSGSRDPPSSVLTAVGETYGLELFLLVLSFIWFLLVGSLAAYHSYLVFHNKTSGDDSKVQHVNVYDTGSVLGNIRRSLLDRFPTFTACEEWQVVDVAVGSGASDCTHFSEGCRSAEGAGDGGDTTTAVPISPPAAVEEMRGSGAATP